MHQLTYKLSCKVIGLYINTDGCHSAAMELDELRVYLYRHECDEFIIVSRHVFLHLS